MRRMVAQTGVCATQGPVMKKHEILSPQSRAALFDRPTEAAAIVRQALLQNSNGPQPIVPGARSPGPISCGCRKLCNRAAGLWGRAAVLLCDYLPDCFLAALYIVT